MIGEIAHVIRQKQGDQDYYFGTVKADKVKNITFVPVIESSRKTPLVELTDDGYQRPGSLSRMRAFAKFLKLNPTHVVPPVLLSSRGKWVFKPNANDVGSGVLEIHGSAAIIDGQHRLGGFVHLYESDGDARDIAFILLPDLSRDAEMKEFVVVNASQKGVPKPLTTYLEDTEEAQVAWALNEEEDSPFRGRITRTSMQRPHLFALHSVAKQIERLFAIGALQDLDVDTKTDFTSRLWTIIADELPDEWSDIEKLDDAETGGRRDFDFKLLELTGFIAWAHSGAQIFARSYGEASGMNWDNVKRLVQAASQIDWRKDGQYQGRTGEYGGKYMADEMNRQLPAEGLAQ